MPRARATEAVALAAHAVWVYAGLAVVVAKLGEGEAASVGAVASVVLLAYLVGRYLPAFDMDERALRAWGTVLSVGLLYLILRVEIAGEPFLWELGWIGDLLSETGATLEGHSGDVAEAILLSAAWIYGVARGARTLRFEGLAGEATAGLVIVLFAALFAGFADAPGIVAWLPVPYMAVALLALALAYLGNVTFDRSRPFAGAWALWVGGSLVAIAAIALPTALVDLGVLAFVGQGLALVAKGIGLALLAVLLPPLVGMAWVMEQVLNFATEGEPFTPDIPTTEELRKLVEDKDSEPALWTKVAGYVLRVGLVALAIALACALLWFAFQRLRHRDEDQVDLREELEVDAAGGRLGSLFGGALGRLRSRFAGGLGGRDAIGRLYLTMLQAAAAQGLARPAAATPLEFAPRLDAHYRSALPTGISRAFAVARYGGREPPRDEVEALAARWRETVRHAPAN